MPEDKSATDEFLDDIPVAEEQGIDDIIGTPQEPQEPEKPHEETVKPHDNREVRRAKAALQRERESNIELNARLQALTEFQKFQQDTKELKTDESLLTLYGSDENGRRAADITQRLLEKTKQEAREEALTAFRAERDAEHRQVAVEEQALDAMLETIEDEYDVDLTSNTPHAKRARQQFFTTLERVSPKDKNGQVTDYADPIATWELMQPSQRQDNSRAKDLGSRSMVRSGASSPSKLEQDATERYLREHGII